MRNQRQIERRWSAPTLLQMRKTVVIADDGVNASVVLFDPGECADEGCLFEYRGCQWVIRGHRHHSRVLVAEPLDELRQ